MTTHDHAHDSLGDSHIDANLWRIVAAAQRAGGDAISDLAARLSKPEEATALLRDALESAHAPLAGFGDARAHLEHSGGIELLRAMKARVKRDLGVEEHDPARRRAALLAFGLVLSAMLAQHRVLGTRASRESVEELLLALCAAEVAWVAKLADKALIVLATHER